MPLLEVARADAKLAQAQLDRAALSISQAGYNTVMNLLRAKVPAIVVPYDEGEETEQIFRRIFPGQQSGA